MSEPILIVIASFLTAVATSVIVAILNRRAVQAKSAYDYGSATQAYADASKIAIDSRESLHRQLNEAEQTISDQKSLISSIISQRDELRIENSKIKTVVDSEESLSDAAKAMIETYQSAVVDPLRKRMGEVIEQISVVEKQKDDLLAMNEFLRQRCIDLERRVPNVVAGFDGS